MVDGLPETGVESFPRVATHDAGGCLGCEQVKTGARQRIDRCRDERRSLDDVRLVVRVADDLGDERDGLVDQACGARGAGLRQSCVHP